VSPPNGNFNLYPNHSDLQTDPMWPAESKAKDITSQVVHSYRSKALTIETDDVKRCHGHFFPYILE